MKNYLVISFLLFSVLGYAQQEAVFTHYYLSPILINPASAGFFERHQLELHARGSWTGFVDAPSTVNANYNGPVGNNFGFGLGLTSESAAQLNLLNGRMNFAFRFPVNKDFKFAAGVAAEYEQLSIDNSITLSSFFQEGDRILERALDGEGEFDASVSIYGTYRDKTFGGLVFTNLVQSKLQDIKTTTSQSAFLNFFIFHLGHQFDVEDLKFSLTPSIMLRQIKDVANQLDFNIKAGFLDDQLVAGLSYRSLGAMGVLLGTKLTNFHLYYSYDLSFQRFQQFNSGSHEITLAFSFKRKDVPGKPIQPTTPNNRN